MRQWMILIATLAPFGAVPAQAQYYNPIPMPDGSAQVYTRQDGMIDYGRPAVVTRPYNPLRDSPANDGFQFNPNMVPVTPSPPQIVIVPRY